MASVLYILCAETPSPPDQALQKLACFLGLRTQLLLLPADLAEPPEALTAIAAEDRILAVGLATLRKLAHRPWFDPFLEATRSIFVHGFSAAQGEIPELKALTRGALSGVTALAPGPHRFAIHSLQEFARFPVAGGSYTSEAGTTGAFAGPGAGQDIQTCISADQRPVFVCATRGGSRLFLLAQPELVDLDTVLAPEVSLRPWYAQLIAVTLFLRSTFGDCCWTSPVLSAAFIVDDPYLKARYGFVHYDTLMSELDRTGSALTIAFIPYNHRRSDPRTIALVRSRPGRFSIAVHGCDHTGGEFASHDEGWLTGTALCALQRMEAHTSQTQLPFDDVMVFPQGLFSTAAIRALKRCRYAAAVNTTPWPVDYQDHPLTVRDVLDVAVTRYESFPIFARRYPRDVFDHAFDALFQKPLLVVEHHGFFRHGYERFVTAVKELSALGHDVQWMPLGKAVKSSCVLKRTGPGQFTVRHFASVLRLKNPAPADLSLCLEKPEQEGVVEAVLVGNHKVPFEIRAGLLHYTADLRHGEELNVTVLHRQSAPARRKPSWKYRFAASARRVLSDVRDNHLARSERALSLAVRVKRMVRGPRCPK